MNSIMRGMPRRTQWQASHGIAMTHHIVHRALPRIGGSADRGGLGDGRTLLSWSSMALAGLLSCFGAGRMVAGSAAILMFAACVKA
jgi:hypothetical protein